MITLTRFDGSQFTVNALMIEFIESTPDSVVSLVNGRKIIVKDPVSDIIERCIEFYKRIGTFNSATLIKQHEGQEKE